MPVVLATVSRWVDAGTAVSQIRRPWSRFCTPADFLLRICVSLRIPLRRWAMQELDSHARIDDADDGCPGYGEPLE